MMTNHTVDLDGTKFADRELDWRTSGIKELIWKRKTKLTGKTVDISVLFKSRDSLALCKCFTMMLNLLIQPTFVLSSNTLLPVFFWR